MTVDPTALNPGDIPDLPPGPFTEQLDEWLRQAMTFNSRPGDGWLPPLDTAGDASADARLMWLHYSYRLTGFLWHSTIAHLLIRIAQTAPEHVDAIAQELADWLDGGDAYREWTWEWAQKRGLDPEAIYQEALAARDATKEASASPETPNPPAAEEELRPYLGNVLEAREKVLTWVVSHPAVAGPAFDELQVRLDRLSYAEHEALGKSLELLGVPWAGSR